MIRKVTLVRLGIVMALVALLEALCLAGVIDKITMSAFESTFLNLAMRDAHLDSFVIAGIALEVGIGPTVRHGLDLNLCPVLALDACGSKNLEVRQHVIAELQETGEVYSSMTAGILEVMNRHGEHAGA